MIKGVKIGVFRFLLSGQSVFFGDIQVGYAWAFGRGMGVAIAPMTLAPDGNSAPSRLYTMVTGALDDDITYDYQHVWLGGTVGYERDRGPVDDRCDRAKRSSTATK